MEEKIWETIKEIYCNKYKENLLDSNIGEFTLSLLFEEKFKEILKDDPYYIENIRKELVRRHEIRLLRTKKRWVKRELEGEYNLFKEMQLLTSIYEESILPKPFKEIYGKDNPTEVYQERIKELSKWSEDVESPLISFRYIKDKKRYQIEKAIKNDFELIIAKIALKEKEENKKSIVNMPNSVRRIPFHVKERGIKIDEDNKELLEIEDNPKLYAVYNYDISDGETFKTLLDTNNITSLNVNNLIEESIKDKIANALDIDDFSVFMYVLSQLVDSVYYTGRTITLSLAEIVNGSFKTKSGANYEKCRNSLYKLGLIRIMKVDKKMRGFVIGIFDSVNIVEGENGENTVVNIVVSNAIMQDLIKRRTISIYGDSLDRLKSPRSRTLAFNLQAERMSHFAKNPNEKRLELPLAYFKSIMFLASNREDRDIKTVEERLKDLKDNELIIKDYKRKGSLFILEFLPLTNEEKADLLPKKIDFLINDNSINDNWIEVPTLNAK